jgi:hypothetical protein
MNTSAFLGTNPMDHAMTSSLPVIECLLEAADRALYKMESSGAGGVIAAHRFNGGLGGVARRSNTSRKNSTVVWNDLASVCGCCPASGVLSPKKASGSNVTL